MSSTTKNLGLFKYDTDIDIDEMFSIDQALNDNWDVLDAKVKQIQDSIPEIPSGGYVEKSGDIMTGNLKVGTNKAYPSTVVQTNTYTYNTAPSESTGIGTFNVLDKNGQWVAMFKAERYTDNHTVVVMQGHSQTGKDGRIQLASDSNGNWHAFCPASADTHSIVTTEGISKSKNGYLKFGNGIIIQWGLAGPYNSNQWGGKTITFPTSFTTAPSACLAYFTAANSGYYVHASSTTKTNFSTTINYWSDSGGGNANYVRWMAIGY